MWIKIKRRNPSLDDIKEEEGAEIVKSFIDNKGVLKIPCGKKTCSFGGMPSKLNVIPDVDASINKSLASALQDKDLASYLKEYQGYLDVVPKIDKVSGKTHPLATVDKNGKKIVSEMEQKKTTANMIAWYLHAESKLLGLGKDGNHNSPVEVAKRNFATLRGCDGQHHRGEQGFINELALAGCDPRSAVAVGEGLYGLNGVRTEDREAIASAFFALGFKMKDKRKEYADLLAGKIKSEKEKGPSASRLKQALEIDGQELDQTADEAKEAKSKNEGERGE